MTAALAAVAIGGCASLPDPGTLPAVPSPYVSSFSDAAPGEALPRGWQPWTLSGLKTPTQYQLVDYAGRTVMQASAQASASGLVHPIEVDAKAYPLLSWRWKVNGLIPGADNTRKHAEDSPVRVVVSFEGGLDRLPLADRLFFDNMRLLTGRQLPYAALMYVWGSRTPRDGIVPNRYTSRIKIIAVQSGPGNLGAWQTEMRNVREDFRRAFKEEPGKIVSIGILTETDVDNRDLETFYGDITFRRGCCH